MTVVDGRAVAPPVDLAVEAGAGTPFGLLRADVLLAVGMSGRQLVLVDGAVVTDDLLLGHPPLLDGVLLVADHHDRDQRSAGTKPTLLELHVTAGPDAGRVHRLGPGRHRVGRSPTMDVALRDGDASRLHAILDVGPRGVVVTDAGSTNGTYLGQAAVGSDPVEVPLGEPLRVGASVLVLRRPPDDAAAVSPTGSGHLHVARAPRGPLDLAEVEVELPAEPPPPEMRPFPLLLMLLPLVLSVPLALLWSRMALLFGVMGPLTVLATVLGDRRASRRRHEREREGHERELADARSRADAALDAERAVHLDRFPDAAALATIAATPTGRLWERRPGDPDFLQLRVGTGTVSSHVVQCTRGAGADRRALPLHGVPVAVSLAAAGVVGVTGPRQHVVGLVRHLLAQVATLHSPRDARITVLTSTPERADEWRWTRWLPHTDRDGAGTGDITVGEERAGPVVAEIVARLDRQRTSTHAAAGTAGPPGVDVVVIDGWSALGRLPAVSHLLTVRGEAAVICLASDGSPPPAQCRVVVEVSGEVGTVLRLTPSPPGSAEVAADLVSASWGESVARSLAPLLDSAGTPAGSVLPPTVNLLDLLRSHRGLDVLDAAAVAAAWRTEGDCTRALLGSRGEVAYEPDLASDGPHVLIAGTTGAGKSELLQTLVVSLAASNPPDRLAFLLIDYKGGAAFAECAHLPHTLGVMTDLDVHLTRRALTSLTAEVRRREALLAEVGVSSHEDYQRALDAGRATAPLPRLVIVVDEFAVLKDELPDFVAGLVRLAAVGRSLGLHLVLATQRPAGAVGPDIRANVNLRIALRVRDSTDAVDVVDSRAPAGISATLPGRAMARSGGDALVEFQTARVSGRCPQPAPAGAFSVRRWPQDEDVGERRECEPGLAEMQPSAKPSDLVQMVASIGDACRIAGIGRPAAPWLPPLPEVLAPTNIRRADARPATGTAGLVIGLLDDPAAQAQPPLVLDPWSTGALAVVGTSRSGRTGVLLAIAAAAAAMPPRDLHVYAVQASGAALDATAFLPHTGAVVRGDDTERLTRLLRRLAQEVRDRRQGPDRLAGAAAPGILVLVDGWESLHGEIERADSGQALEWLLLVLREGPAVGVTTVITGDRSLVTGRLAAALPQRLILRTADAADAVLAGATIRDLPSHLPPGRGLLTGADGCHEVQICATPSLEAVVQAARQRWGVPDRPPWRVDPLPDVVTETDLRLRHSGSVGPRAAAALPIGLGGDDVVPLTVDVAGGTSMLVAGPPGSGRSSAITLLARALDRAGVPVIVLRARASAASDALPAAATVLGPGDVEGLRRLLSAPAGPTPVALVDDLDAVEGYALDDLLASHLLAAATRGGGVVVAGAPTALATRFRGVVTELRRSRTGILLSPTGYADGDLLGVTVRRAGDVRPGRGYLVRHGRVDTVQLAVPGTDRPQRCPVPVPGMLAP